MENTKKMISTLNVVRSTRSLVEIDNIIFELLSIPEFYFQFRLWVQIRGGGHRTLEMSRIQRRNCTNAQKEQIEKNKPTNREKNKLKWTNTQTEREEQIEMNKHTNREKKINLHGDLHKWKDENLLKCRPPQMKRKKDNLLANMSRQNPAVVAWR